MRPIHTLLQDIGTAAHIDGRGDDAIAHATLLRCIQELTLAAETPLETVKRIIYQLCMWSTSHGTDFRMSKLTTQEQIRYRDASRRANAEKSRSDGTTASSKPIRDLLRSGPGDDSVRVDEEKSRESKTL
ncbi:MAG: hypothetical protein Q9222_004392 [Ikaeria aurantiellina]